MKLIMINFTAMVTREEAVAWNKLLGKQTDVEMKDKGLTDKEIALLHNMYFPIHDDEEILI